MPDGCGLWGLEGLVGLEVRAERWLRSTSGGLDDGLLRRHDTVGDRSRAVDIGADQVDDARVR